MRTHIRRLHHLVAIIVLAWPYLGQAATIAWTGGADADWQNAANWTPPQVPTVEDTVSIPAGTVSAPATWRFGTLLLSGAAKLQTSNTVTGTLVMTNTAFVSGPLVVANGAKLLIGGGSVSSWVRIENGGTLESVGSAHSKVFSGGLTNSGIIRQSGWGLQVADSAAAVNQTGAVWDIQDDSGVYDDGVYEVTETFRNEGLLVKSGGTGMSIFSLILTNVGRVKVQSGTLAFYGGGQLDGVWEVAAGARADFADRGFGYTPPVNWLGEGEYRLLGGGLVLDRVIPNLQVLGGSLSLTPGFQGGAITNFSLSAGTVSTDLPIRGTLVLSGNAKLQTSNTVSGMLVMTNTASVSGPLVVANGATLVMGGGSVSSWVRVEDGGTLESVGSAHSKVFSGGLTNAGTIRQSGWGLQVANYSSALNQAGAVWEIQDDSHVYGYTMYETFRNEGLLFKSGGAGMSTFSLILDKVGLVEVLSGTLWFAGGGLVDGTFETAANAATVFGGGAFTCAPPATFVGAGEFRFDGGTLVLRDGTADVDLTLNGATLLGSNVVSRTLNLRSGTVQGPLVVAAGGVMNWTGGNVRTAVQVESGGEVNLTGGAEKHFYGAWTNFGTVRQRDWGLLLRDGATVVNGPGAVWDFQDDSSLHWATATEAFRNEGKVVKSGGIETSTFNPPLTNSGMVELRSGTLRLNNSGVFSGTWRAAAGAVVEFAGETWATGSNCVFEGDGEFRFVGSRLDLGLLGVPPRLQLAAGEVYLDDTFQGGSITNLTVSGSIVHGARRVTGQLVWLGGSLADTGLVVESGATLVVNTVVSTGTIGGSLTNRGLILLDGGSPQFGTSGAQFVNEAGAEIRCRNTGGAGFSATDPNQATFRNRGALTKQVGTAPVGIGMSLINEGTLDIQRGNLHCSRDLQLLGGLLRFGVLGRSDSGRLEIAGSAAISGGVAVLPINGYAPSIGSVLTVVRCASRTGEFTSIGGLDRGLGPVYVPEFTATGVNLRTVGESYAPSAPQFLLEPQDAKTTQGWYLEIPAYVTGSPPIRFQWVHNGRPVANGPRIWGAQTPSLGVFDIEGVDAGTYQLVLTNSAGSLVSRAVQVEVVGLPTVRQEPQSLMTTIGQSLQLEGGVVGDQLRWYQWQKDGTNLLDGGGITGTVLPRLSLDGSAIGLSGDYRLLVGSDAGVVTGAVTHVTITASPVLPEVVRQPASHSLDAGDEIVLEVEASGSLPLAFQWRKDGNPILGATERVWRKVADPADLGLYDVVVRNAAGEVESQFARVEVVSQPNVEPVRLELDDVGSGSLRLQSSGPTVGSWLVEESPDLVQWTWAGALPLEVLGNAAPQRFFRATLDPDAKPQPYIVLHRDTNRVWLEAKLPYTNGVYFVIRGTSATNLLSEGTVIAQGETPPDQRVMLDLAPYESLDPAFYSITQDPVLTLADIVEPTLEYDETSEGGLSAGVRTVATVSTPSGSPSSSNLPPIHAWPSPVPPIAVTGAYGEWPGHTSITNVHSGIDLRAEPGTAVKSVADGRVLLVGNAIKGDDTGENRYVVVEHDSRWATVYVHVSEDVEVGETVGAGDEIAEVGDTVQPHLHFGVLDRSRGKAHPGLLREVGPAVNPLEHVPELRRLYGAPELLRLRVAGVNPGRTVDTKFPELLGPVTGGSAFVTVQVQVPGGYKVGPSKVEFFDGEDMAVPTQSVDLEFFDEPTTAWLYLPNPSSRCGYAALGESDMNVRARRYRYFFTWDIARFVADPEGPRTFAIQTRSPNTSPPPLVGTYKFGPEILPIDPPAPVPNAGSKFSINLIAHLGAFGLVNTLNRSKKDGTVLSYAPPDKWEVSVGGDGVRRGSKEGIATCDINHHMQPTAAWFRVKPLKGAKDGDLVVTARSENLPAIAHQVKVPLRRAPLDAPIALLAEKIDDASFTAVWTDVPDALKFVLEVSTTDTFEAGSTAVYQEPVRPGEARKTEWRRTAAAPELRRRDYWYRVRALDDDRTSDPSNVRRVVAQPNQIPEISLFRLLDTSDNNNIVTSRNVRFAVDATDDTGLQDYAFVVEGETGDPPWRPIADGQKSIRLQDRFDLPRLDPSKSFVWPTWRVKVLVRDRKGPAAESGFIPIVYAHEIEKPGGLGIQMNQGGKVGPIDAGPLRWSAQPAYPIYYQGDRHAGGWTPLGTVYGMLVTSFPDYDSLTPRGGPRVRVQYRDAERRLIYEHTNGYLAWRTMWFGADGQAQMNRVYDDTRYIWVIWGGQ